jgi:3-oxocholest-4-en-26-oate---CoA ligase
VCLGDMDEDRFVTDPISPIAPPWTGDDFSTVFFAVGLAVPQDRPALIHGNKILTWGQSEAIVQRIAEGLVALGLKPGDIVGQQMRNGPEYILLFLACSYAGLIPVNINYHYKASELRDIVDRFKIACIVHNAEFRGVAEEASAGNVDIILIEAEGGLAGLSGPAFDPPSDDRLFFVATGGTTGMPKAVMWKQQESWQALMVAVWPMPPGMPPVISSSLDDHVAKAASMPPARTLILSPMMHGVGLYSSLITLLRGGTLVTIDGTKFDPNAVIDTIKMHDVQSLVLVGDAFALPIIEALEKRADAADALSSLKAVQSSGAVFSQSHKEAFLRFNPGLMVIDALGSSESAGTAVKIMTAAGSIGGDAFMPVPGRTIRLFNADGSPLPEGSGEGIVGRSGPLPLGYFGEDELSARTFPTVDGVRYLVTGDRARIDEAGTITFLGRDNLCINTGGEKVFPEEVETILCAHEAVDDARVMGVADPRFGQKIVAVVRGDPSARAALETHVKTALASYKCPKDWHFTDKSLRLNNGKPDYKTAREIVEGTA